MYLSIYSHPNGVTTESGPRAVYDIANNSAQFGPATVDGPALRWEFESRPGPDAILSSAVELRADTRWLMRCDRIDFPPGGIAYRHTHPGPGIRCLLFGSLTVESPSHTEQVSPHGPWFESGPEPVLATAATDQPSAFVRVMLLPEQWRGRRTISYVNPSDAERPARQSATVYFDELLEL